MGEYKANINKCEPEVLSSMRSSLCVCPLRAQNGIIIRVLNDTDR